MTTSPSFPARTFTDDPAADGNHALVLQGVHRWYGQVQALAPLTLRLSPGVVCVVSGPNGSGKTTLLRVAAGLVQPSGGRRAAHAPALYVPPGGGARLTQTVRQAVGFAAVLGGGTVEDAIEATGLADLCGRRVGELSAGQRGRVSLAVIVAARPAVACLDEPDAHLDASARRCAAHVAALLADRGAAVLVATHDRRFLTDRRDGEVVLVGAAAGRAA
jgi:ABC-type multidrug transport system ATPase subunit